MKKCLCLLLSIAIFTIGCGKTPEPSPGKESADSSTSPDSSDVNSNQPDPKKETASIPDINDEAFHKDLVDAANDYLSYGMVIDHDELTAPNIGIADCAPAIAPSNPSPSVSQSDDESTHGQKLYFLFASDIAHYMNQDGTKTPVGQTIVKEAWESQPGSSDARNVRNHSSGHRINPRATVNGQTLEIAKRSNLFIMKKLDPQTAGTDAGWVYGIVEADSKKVIASGNVASCASCHADAKNDRQFGPKIDLGQQESPSTGERE